MPFWSKGLIPDREKWTLRGVDGRTGLFGHRSERRRLLLVTEDPLQGWVWGVAEQSVESFATSVSNRSFIRPGAAAPGQVAAIQQAFEAFND